MKCYQSTQRGILLSSKPFGWLRIPVVFDESLLRDPSARFGDDLVFADSCS